MIPLTEIILGRAPSREKIAPGFTRSSRLSVLVLNLTKRCPLRCLYCYAEAGSTQDLELNLAEKILREFADSGGRIVILSGGEPLLYPGVLHLLDLCGDLGLTAIVSSCGVVPMEILKALPEHGVRYVGVSIDTGIPQLEQRIRTGIDLSRVLETVKYAKELGLEVGIRATLTWANIGLVERLADLCSSLGVSRLCLYFLVPSGRAAKLGIQLEVDSATLLRLMLHLVKLVKRYPDTEILLVTEPSAFILTCLYVASSRTEFEDLVTKFSRRARCTAAEQLVAVNSDGFILPCQFAHLDMSPGTVRELSLEVALNKMRSLVNAYRCRDCALADLCRGCAVRIYSQKTRQDPMCLLRALTVVRPAGLPDWKIRLAKEITQASS